jgi:murein DD-endopeptidase MepM/ murein hydrolase activator NlpD
VSVIALLLPTPAAAQFWPNWGGRTLSRDGLWMFPVIGGVLSSDEDDHLQRGSVYAWDVSAPYGSFVFSMATGRVSYAGCNNAGGYGCWALIDHGDGYLSLYGHMIDEGGGNIRVQTGDRVSAWTPLGRVGWTGMTSFGPHVHWEIHDAERGRVRNDRFFSRSAVTYCKFCAADGTAAQAVGTSSYVGGMVLSPEFVLALVLFLLGALIFFQPALVANSVQRAGALVWRFFHQTQTAWQERLPWRTVRWSTIVLAFLVPAFVCSTGTAVAVWMADEQIDPRTLLAYFRFGFYPYPGEGYQLGARYSAVWGMPCQGVGTLGRSCTVSEVVESAVAWQQSVARFSRMNPTPVAIVRLGAHFTKDETRRLLTEMHYVNGLAIVDVGSDFKEAHDVVEELTTFGLDGIAIDMEFADQIRQRDIYWLTEAMAERRKAAKLPGQAVLILWNVFHNIDDGSNLTSGDVQVIPIFTGYGPTDTKLAGLAKTQTLFGVEPLQSGLMAFDQRWPINRRCKTFNTTLGFDCQDWRALFAQPAAAGTGWWVQQ